MTPQEQIRWHVERTENRPGSAKEALEFALMTCIGTDFEVMSFDDQFIIIEGVLDWCGFEIKEKGGG